MLNRSLLNDARNAFDRFLLREAETIAARVPEAIAARVVELHAVAVRHLAAGEGLTGWEMTPSALLLQREGLQILAKAARLQSADGDANGAGSADESLPPAFAALARVTGAVPPPHAVETMTSLMAGASLEWAALAPDELMAFRLRVDECVRWLRGVVDPRTPRRIRFVRSMRIAAALVATALVLGWGVTSLLSSKNIALHRPVSTSGVWPLSPSSKDGSGAVNGIVESTHGVHTVPGTFAWIRVDLQESFRVSSVKIYNRGEESFQDEGLPLILETSQDGIIYKLVETKTTHFSQSSPWQASLDGARVRYVRIRNARPTYIALSEIEIYGRR